MARGASFTFGSVARELELRGVYKLKNGVGPVREHLRFRFDPNELDTLGIWIDRGGWSCYHPVTKEPTNGAPDPLDEAVSKWGRFGSLGPYEKRHWQVAIEVGCSLPTRTSSL